jgi:myo-inositol-1(or 4)-monophosphatase
MVRGSGEILFTNYEKQFEINKKGTIDLVTEVDLQSEAFLLQTIQENYPNHRVITEESGEMVGDKECVWYLDPLDGTINFAHGVPFFSVSAAFYEDGVPKYGVVYDPMRDECFSAESGCGAWLNGKPLRVSSIKKLSNSLLVTGFPYDTWSNPDNNLDYFNRFMLRSQGVRRLGSAALDLCYVAAGRFEGYWEVRLYPWDIAAGALIVHEAGGLVTDLGGNDNFFVHPYSVLATNSEVHSDMLSVLHEDN